MNKLVNKVENKLLEDFNTLEMSIQKCSMNEGNEGSGAYVELYTIFKHLYPSMRDAFDDILQAKSEKYQNIYEMNARVKELLSQDYYME